MFQGQPTDPGEQPGQVPGNRDESFRPAPVTGSSRGYRQMLKGLSPEEIAKEEWPLASALEKNTLAFRVLRVENWSPDRCRPDQQRDFNYLLYMTDAATGEEIGRAFVSQAGLLSGWTLAPEDTEPHTALYRASVAPRLEEALTEAYSRFGIKGSRAQYVMTWGAPECPLPSPCVAFRAGEKAYLFRSGELVELTAASRAYSRAEMEATRTRIFEISSGINSAKEWLVSIADGRWVLALRVKAKP